MDVFDYLRHSAVKGGAIDNRFYGNFTDTGLEKEKANLIHRLKPEDLYPELKKRASQARF